MHVFLCLQSLCYTKKYILYFYTKKIIFYSFLHNILLFRFFRLCSSLPRTSQHLPLEPVFHLLYTHFFAFYLLSAILYLHSSCALLTDSCLLFTVITIHFYSMLPFIRFIHLSLFPFFPFFSPSISIFLSIHTLVVRYFYSNGSLKHFCHAHSFGDYRTLYVCIFLVVAVAGIVFSYCH